MCAGVVHGWDVERARSVLLVPSWWDWPAHEVAAAPVHTPLERGSTLPSEPSVQCPPLMPSRPATWAWLDSTGVPCNVYCIHHIWKKHNTSSRESLPKSHPYDTPGAPRLTTWSLRASATPRPACCSWGCTGTPCTPAGGGMNGVRVCVHARHDTWPHRHCVTN